eukprot:PhF_6_TR34933/c0_g1_i2/m.50634/K11093/SNRP70; U1 small nuclear ribonucleoprotein 70kDa
MKKLKQYFYPGPDLIWTETLPSQCCRRYDGVAELMGMFERKSNVSPEDTKKIEIEDLRCRWSIRSEIKRQRQEEDQCEQKKRWDPSEDPNIADDAASTMILFGLTKSSTEDRIRAHLRSLLGCDAQIRWVRVVRDRRGISRGYCFVVLGSETEVLIAVRKVNNSMFDGKHIKADKRRGGVDKDFTPQRLLKPDECDNQKLILQKRVATEFYPKVKRSY